jgi:phage baseplate assembly protein W
MSQGIIFNNKNSSVKFDKDYLSARLERLLFVEKSEILGFPDFGSYLPEFFHEPEDETIAEEIINEITFLIQTYEPDLEIEDITAEILGTDSGQNGILIKMNIYIIETQTIEEIKIFKIQETT